MSRSLRFDVVVIGGGIAGLMSSVVARRTDRRAEVAVLDKCVVGKSGSSVQAKGLAAVGDWSFEEDSKKLHLQDTLAAGAGLNFMPVAERMVFDIESAVGLLEEMGMRFDPKSPAHYSSPGVPSAGHRHYRYVNLRDGTGKVMQDILRRAASRCGVHLVNGYQVISLVRLNERCSGVVAFDIATGDLVSISARSVIVATGGAGYLYERTSNPPQVTGDGIWLAYRAGAILQDLEMVQFYPVNYIHPRALEGKNVGSYDCARLYNAEGERFMARYDPEHLENTTRDLLAQAIYQEIQQGRGTEHGGVVIDRTGMPSEYYQQFPVEIETTLDGGLDIRTETGEVSPASHYLMGGISIDADCRTSLPGLYAAGESAAGVHGANRLANNSLSDTLVLGLTAGRTAVVEGMGRHAESADLFRMAAGRHESELEAPLRSKGEASPFSWIRRVRHWAWAGAGVVRSARGLRQLLANLAELEAGLAEKVRVSCTSRQANMELSAFLELGCMVGVGQLIAASALHRTETRGAHCREDFPDRDDERWLCNVIIHSEGGQLQISEKPVASDPERAI